jgi:hypothetical protein
MGDLEALVERWCNREEDLAFLPKDHAAIWATTSARMVIMEAAGEPGVHPDLFRACAVLGRLIAECGGSPSLASWTIDALQETMPSIAPDTARAARAALSEGFVASRSELARAEAAARWEYPGCVVPLEHATVAIVASYPDDDEDALAAWAARVASAVARSGYRRAVVAGADKTRGLLLDALELAGVKVITTSPPSPVARPR